MRGAVSNTIRYDSLLVRELARELRGLLVDRRVRALRFDRDNGRVLLRAGSQSLLWDLDPRRGTLQRVRDDDVKGNVALVRGSIVADVSAPSDERLITITFRQEEPDSGSTEEVNAGALVVELIAPRWNAAALGADGRVNAVLRARAAGDRPLMAGTPYAPPAAAGRVGARFLLPLDDWLALLEPLAHAERTSALLRQVAWTSPINAAHILGDAAYATDEGLLADAWERYRALYEPLALSPSVLHTPRGPQPYPFALHGVRCVRALSLLDAFEATAGDESPAMTRAATATAAALERLRRKRERAENRRARLQQELQNAAPEAAALRRQADLLLAQMHNVPRGAAEAELDDFEGGRVHVTLDPALGAADNARHLYDSARKRERAATRLPALLKKTGDEIARLDARLSAVESGQLDPDAAAPDAAVSTRPTHTGPALPYRRYHTSGGLEVRVGRGAASNDQLTLHHSSPNDIWMHARQVAGAHVVLRWNDRNANPPQADLIEAAVLAALHSRARTSGTVPVDWTRRKYVRKPRGARAGSVVVERARTLFVSPAEEIGKKLRDTE